MLNLNDREWKAFKVKHIFSIEKCKCSNVSTLKQGTFPYVGATNRNNGIMSFVEKKDKWVTKGNCIVFICDGQGSVGYSIYKKEDFIGSTTLKVGRSEHLNRYTAQFLVSALDKNRQMYSYGYKRNENRLSNESIMLPTTDDEQPDYAFMEQYIREREDKLKQKYIDFIGDNYDIGGVLPSLEEKAWKAFVISDLFDSYTGTDLIISKITEGEIPVISHAATNNGIACYSAVIERRPIFSHNNTISLADRGNFKAFVQKTDFYIGTRVKALVSKNVLSKEVLIFIANSIDKQAVKFSYGYNATDNIDKLHIMLPTTDEGSPDYEYMEQYIKAVMFGKYKKYLEYQKCPLL